MSRVRHDRSLLASLAKDGRRAPRVRLRSLEGEQAPPATSSESRYELVDRIGAGGMGVIVRARDVDIGREVAIKVIRPEHADRPDVVQRFVEEAQIGGQLQHPGLVPVYEIGVLADRRPFFAMKLVKGTTLKAALDDREDVESDQGRLLRVFDRICDAMAYVHARGVVHRDLKPANILIGAFGEVQVVDWGLAKVLERGGVADERKARRKAMDTTVVATVRSGSDDYPSQDGVMMGTPEYMPPEQAAGDVDGLDERADVFALGAILCQILTGVPPYWSEDGLPVVLAVKGSLDPALDRLAGCRADPALIDICVRCLAHDRTDRPRSAGRLVDLLRAQQEATEQRVHQAELDAVESRVRAERSRARADQARTAAGAQRRARLQAVGIAAVVLLTLLVGGGGYVANLTAAQDRQARTTGAVQSALHEAKRLQGAEAWSGAVEAAMRAVQLAEAGSVDVDTRGRAVRLLDDVRESKAGAEADAAMLAALDGAREVWGRSMNPRVVDSGYQRAFADFGIDPFAAEADHSSFRASPIATALAEGLTAWMILRGTTWDLRELPTDPLLQAAAQIDPDPDRKALRKAMVHRGNFHLPRIYRRVGPETMTAGMRGLVGVSLAKTATNNLAQSLLATAAARHADDPWLLMQLGVVLVYAKNREAAIRHFVAAVTLRPDSPMLHVHLGDAYIGGNQAQTALPIYRRARALDRTTLRAYVGEAFCHYDAERWDEAQEILEAGIEVNDQEWYLHWVLGDVHRSKKDFVRAQGSYARAIEVAPRLGSAHRSMGELHLYHTRDYAAAAESYAKAVDLDPLHAASWRNYGSSLIMGGKHKEAIAPLERALLLDPDDVYSHVNLGRAYWMEREYAKAAPHIRRALEMGSTDVPAGYDVVAERMAAAQGRLPSFKAGTHEPEDAAEWVTFGDLLYDAEEYVASADAYAGGFELDTSLIAGRYNASCAAALAGGGEGLGAESLDAEARRANRDRALAWLRVQLDSWKRRLAEGEVDAATVTRTMNHWGGDTDLRSVRDAVPQMAADEQQSWVAFWTDVNALLR